MCDCLDVRERCVEALLPRSWGAELCGKVVRCALGDVMITARRRQQRDFEGHEECGGTDGGERDDVRREGQRDRRAIAVDGEPPRELSEPARRWVQVSVCRRQTGKDMTCL